MANLKKNFISFVALGGQNPQIINVDFLKDNKIIPIDEPPFDELLKQEKPFTKFVSTPVLANLVLENIEFIIDESRFQIQDIAISKWTGTKILNIAEKYFDTLPYTPLKIVGINFNVAITFDNPKENLNFQELVLSEGSKIKGIISKDNITADLVLRYPYTNDKERIQLSLKQSNKQDNKRVINFNYEFNFSDWSNFKTELKKFSELADYFDSILEQIIKTI